MSELQTLQNTLDNAKRILAVLEVQAAGYTVLTIPAHLVVELEDKRKDIAELEAKIKQNDSSNVLSIDQILKPKNNLPSRPYTQFIGREKELEELKKVLLPSPQSRHYIVTVDGIGGLGKTALALELAHQYRENYYDLNTNERFELIIWLSAKNSILTATKGIQPRPQTFSTLNDLCEEVIRVLGKPNNEKIALADKRFFIEQTLGEQRTLLLLDNLETVDDPHLFSFLNELPEPTKVVVTTRYRIDTAYPIRLRTRFIS